ncbi:MAG: hypothetical protein NZ936_01430 [Alphaproteobacteria bacterium]|nr:hypothetical protein [Alphaproteobacteria bacterium]
MTVDWDSISYAIHISADPGIVTALRGRELKKTRCFTAVLAGEKSDLGG